VSEDATTAAPASAEREDADRLAAPVAARVGESHDETTVDVDGDRLVELLAAAADAGYDFLVDLCAVDHLGFGGEVAGYWSSPSGTGSRDLNHGGSSGLAVVPLPLGPTRFSVSYQLLARGTSPPRRLRVRTWVEDGEAVPTATGVFPCADYPEREAFDLMGIPFAGHPNLERIFLPEGWDGHPHRKDYPIGGEPVQFSDEV
jgi:NADH:ubiquinone oxidoreductase subunit C